MISALERVEMEMESEMEKQTEKEKETKEIKNEMRLELKSKSANEAFARVAVAAFASQLDPTLEQLADIKTAVSEAITNCIIHAYEDSEGLILIHAWLTSDSIIVEIIDYGKGIENIAMARQTLYTSKPDADRSGMGFTIMESFMDELSVESIVNMGTKIRMKKKLKEDV